MGRFDNIKAQPSKNGRFDNIESTIGRFDNIGVGGTTKEGLFRRTARSFGGLVGKVGHYLNVGQYAQVGATEKALEKAGVLKSTDIKGTGIKEGLKEEKSNIQLLQRIGKEKTQPGTLASIVTGNYIPTQSVFGNFVQELPVTSIGLMGDIFLDPTFILSKIGVFKKTAGLIGKELKGAGKYLAKEIPAVQKVGDMLGTAFVNRYGQREAFKQIDIQRKIEESLVGGEVKKLVSPIIEKPLVIQQRIKQVIEGGITSDKELKTLAIPIREELDRVGKSISDLNPKLLDETLFEANKGTYFPRLYSNFEFPKEEEKIVSQFFKPTAVSVPKARFMARKLTAEEAKATPTLIKEAGYPAAKGLTELRIVETRQKFFNEVSKLASEEAKPGWIQMSDNKTLGNLAGKFLPKAEYAAITQIRKIPSVVEETYDSALRVWKASKTAFNPATISRNDLTNFFILNPLGGVGPHRLDIYAKATNEIVTGGPLYQLARKNGLEISTQEAAELKKSASVLYREQKGTISKVFGKFDDFYNTVVKFYGNQDKFFKLANFIKGTTEDGLTPYQAMRRANFYLIDYSEVPETIKWLRKSPIGVPFISFTYGVTQPLAKTLLEEPSKLANYFKVLSAIQGMNPLGETPQQLEKEMGVLPEWISKGTYLKLPWKDKYGRGQYVNLQYILPTNILEEKSITPSSPVFTIMSSLIMNKDSFTEKEIWLKTDTEAEKLQKETTYILRQLVPSLAPFGYSFDKVMALLQNRPDLNGYIREALPVLFDVLGGIKVTPLDYSIEAQKRAREKQKEIEDLRTQLFIIMKNKTLLPEEKEREKGEIIEKIKRTVQ